MLSLRLECLIVVVLAILVVVTVLVAKLVHLLWACSELIGTSISTTHLVYE